MEIERKTRPFLTANGDKLQHCTCASLSVQTHRDRLLHLALCRVAGRDGSPPPPQAPTPATLLGVIQSLKRLGERERGGTLEHHIRLLLNDPPTPTPLSLRKHLLLSSPRLTVMDESHCRRDGGARDDWPASTQTSILGKNDTLTSSARC